MGKFHFARVLHQQHCRLGFDLLPRLVPMRLHQRKNSSHLLRSAQALQGYGLFPRTHVGGPGCPGLLCHPLCCSYSASRSPDILESGRPKSLLAQHSGSRMSRVFIFLYNLQLHVQLSEKARAIKSGLV
jgi:hypothetical protein